MTFTGVIGTNRPSYGKVNRYLCIRNLWTMKKHIIILVLLICFCSCSSNSETDTGHDRYRNTENAKKLLDSLSVSGKYERILHISDSICGLNPSSEVYNLISSYKAFSYVKLNNRDSARKYLDICQSGITEDSPRYAAYHNIEAEYALKFELDHSSAIKHFKTALAYSEKNGNVSNQAILLCNICTLYLFRGDTICMDYAQKAYDLAYGSDNPYLSAFSASILSASEALIQQYENAIRHSEEALSIINRNPELFYMKSEIHSNLGNIYTQLFDFNRARYQFVLAINNLIYTDDKNIDMQIYLSYANMEMMAGQYITARKYLMLAKEISESNNNIDVAHNIYYGLYRVYDHLGPVDSALHYLSIYVDRYNTYFNIQKENEFNEILHENEKIKYENIINKKELNILRSRRTIQLFSLVILFLSTVGTITYVSKKKKDKLYEKLVIQHQQFLDERDRESEIKKLKKSQSQEIKDELVIFNKIEEIMSEKKLYRDKEISLGMIAELLGTNKTYISKIINKYTSKSFYNYIHSLRINDAIKAISDTENEVVLKALIDELGYKSASPFYRAFQNETGCTPAIYRENILKLKKQLPKTPN